MASTRDPAAVQNATPGRDSAQPAAGGAAATNGIGIASDEGIGES
jgi:hypothetical protein